MKVTIEVNDIELFAKGLNNAIAAYGNIVYAIDIGCEIPSIFEALRTISYDDLRLRYNCLVDAYRQIEQVEKELCN